MEEVNKKHDFTKIIRDIDSIEAKLAQFVKEKPNSLMN
jgi:hypothetical protein